MLLLLATVSGNAIQAKDFTSRNLHLSNDYDNDYLPYPDGTPVIYEDQDGTL